MQPRWRVTDGQEHTRDKRQRQHRAERDRERGLALGDHRGDRRTEQEEADDAQEGGRGEVAERVPDHAHVEERHPVAMMTPDAMTEVTKAEPDRQAR